MANATARLLAYMDKHHLVLATAESCTTGLIASQLADCPGAGKCLDRAFVTYSVGAKKQMLGVSQQTLDENNLTSEAVACEMAVGALDASEAAVAISNTGVVDDSDPAIPAGTQCFGWAFKLEDGRTVCFTETKQFTGERRAIREASAAYALSRLMTYHDRASTGQQNEGTI